MTGGVKNGTREIHPGDCFCAYCRNDKEFVAPPHLIDKILKGEVVLFAGAGISTENKAHCKSTFYEEIQADLKITDRPTFPELMTKFCALPDGRIKLLEKIKHRFDYFKSFDDFYHQMTRFHRAISPLYMITDVITTNWDDFFERECNLDSFVYDGDMAFWDASNRRIMKIHGSITNFGSIVATSEDYQQSYKRLNDGPLGGQLKSLIARKTIIYVGYSLSDENYLRLLRNIAKMMNGNIRQSYFIAPSIDEKGLKSAPIPLVPIETDGGYFFEEVRKLLADRCEMTKDSAFFNCDLLLDEAADKHNKTADKFIKTQHPILIFVLSYQDGLIHALQRIHRMRKSGEYYSMNGIRARVRVYEHKIREYLGKGDFWNAAYAQGYQAGLLYLLLKSEDANCPTPPLIDAPFEFEAASLAAVLRAPKERLPRKAAVQARKILLRHPKAAQLIPDHTPYL
jgi:NAD-dependent SIR2 family protein deacetylase